MIIDVTMKGLKCDRCGELYTACGDFSDYDPIVAKPQFEEQLKQDALGTDWIEHNGRQYCDHCWELNGDDSVPLPLIQCCRSCGATERPYNVVELEDGKSVWWQAEDLCRDCASVETGHG